MYRVPQSPAIEQNHGVDDSPLCVIFDGDDTLWLTEPLYDEARSAARQIVEASGLDGARWESLERSIDVENVAVLGHSADRFPQSCRQAYAAIAAASNVAVEPRTCERIERAARSVFERPAQLMPDAHETLRALKALGARLGLLTKGDPLVQRKRIDDSTLAPFFDAISIVPTKSAEEVHALVQRLGSTDRSVWVVGNSVRSDIVPALAAGANAIWIDSHVWEYERTHDAICDERVIRAERLADVLKVVGVGS